MKLKQEQNIFHVVVNASSCISNQKWNKKSCQCECKYYRKSKQDYIWNSSACICEDRKYLNIFVDTAITTCDEIPYGYCINKKERQILYQHML